MKTEEIVRSLRWCGTRTEEGCNDCAFEPQCDEDAVGCVGDLCDTAADKIEELTDRCARYAEEIAVLREKQRWVDAKERQPEYGVSVLAVAGGKAANITLCDAIVFATFWDGWELDDYPQAENVTVKWWRPMVESPEGGDGECEV